MQNATLLSAKTPNSKKRVKNQGGGKINKSASHLVGPYVLFSYPEKIRGLSRKTTEEIDFEKKNLAKILIWDNQYFLKS